MNDLPPDYQALLNIIERAMHAASQLGMYRTSHKLHRALAEGRNEVFEALPSKLETPIVTWNIGPVTEQPKG